jgi:small subunit ribosomal protein S10
MKKITQLNIKSSNFNSFKIYNFCLTKLLKHLNIKYSFIKLPVKKKKITLIKSPHVDKNAREQFEIITYLSCFKIMGDINLSLFSIILLNKPATIQLKIK